MRVRFRQLLLLFCLCCFLVSGAVGSGPSPGADPEEPPRPRLAGLPGPGGTGLLPIEVSRPQRTHGDLGLDVETFLFDVVDRTRERIAWKEIAFRVDQAPILTPSSPAYGALMVGGESAGVAMQPPGGWDPGPAGAALVLGLSYLTEGGMRTLRGCRAFLEARGEALRTFWNSRRGPDGETVSPGLLAAVEERKSEIRSYSPCRGLLPPAPPRGGPVRPEEPR